MLTLSANISPPAPSPFNLFTKQNIHNNVDSLLLHLGWVYLNILKPPFIPVISIWTFHHFLVQSKNPMKFAQTSQITTNMAMEVSLNNTLLLVIALSMSRSKNLLLVCSKTPSPQLCHRLCLEWNKEGGGCTITIQRLYILLFPPSIVKTYMGNLFICARTYKTITRLPKKL